MANPYYVQSLSGLNPGAELQEVLDRRELAEQKEQQSMEQEKAQDLLRKAYGGDADSIKEVFAMDPDIGLKLKAIEDERLAKLGQQRKQVADNANFEYSKSIRMARTPEEKQEIINRAIEDPTSDLYDEEDIGKSIEEMEADANINLYTRVGEKGYRTLFGAEETRDKYEQGKGKLSGYVFNRDTGEYSVNPNIKERIDSIKENVPILDAKTRQGINKDFTQLTKDTKLIRNTAQDLDRLAKVKSGPASIAMVFKFMKALDPTSVVREGEFATAEKSAGIPEAVRNTYNKLISGEKLGEKQMQEFITTAKQLANSAIDSSTDEVDSFIATFEDTIPKGFKSALKNRIPKRFDVSPSKNKRIDAPSSALEFLKANPNFKEQFKDKYGYLPEGI